MSLPDAPELLVSLLRAAERGQSVASLTTHLEASLAKSYAMPPGSLPAELRGRLAETVRQATQTLAAAGLLLWTDDGLWYPTEQGRQALAGGLSGGSFGQAEPGPGPASAPASTPTLGQRPRRYRGGNRSREARRELLRAEAPEQAPAERLSRAAAAADAALAAELLARLREKPPAFLERSVLVLLGALGYGTPQPRPACLRSSRGDGGIDGIVAADALGLERVAVQTKRYAADKTVGVRAVRDFYAALERAQARKGVIAATTAFSGEARETAAALSKPVVLIDGAALARLMIRHEVGCRVVACHRVAAIDEGFFAEDDEAPRGEPQRDEPQRDEPRRDEPAAA